LAYPACTFQFRRRNEINGIIIIHLFLHFEIFFFENIRKNVIFVVLKFLLRIIRKNMAHHKSALKRIRQSRKRRIYNRGKKRTLKFALRAVREAKTYEEACDNLKQATRVLDRISSIGIIHKNAASNRKSSLAKFVNSLKTVPA
jgi:small subunit ribosomal protein S20